MVREDAPDTPEYFLWQEDLPNTTFHPTRLGTRQSSDCILSEGPFDKLLVAANHLHMIEKSQKHRTGAPK